MTITISDPGRPTAGGSADPAQLRRKKNRPVLYWAALGVGFLLLETYVFTRWILSSPHATAVGSTPPGRLADWAIAIQILSVAFFATAVWRLLVRPLRRDGKITLDGMLVAVFILIYWQDPMGNYQSQTFTYNSNYLNFGSWANFIPGWQSPNADRFPEALLLLGLIYVWGILPGMMLGCLIMRKVRERWPHLSGMTIAGIGWAFFVAFDTFAEPIFMGLFGAWAYPGAAKEWTIFHGHYYQFPMYEALFWGTGWFLMAAVRFFKNDRGETFVERGIEDVHVGFKGKVFIRIMALSGVMNVIFLCGYNLPFTYIPGAHQDPWIQDVTSRSYFTSEACGPGTTFLCPGTDTPIFKKESGYRVTPDGRLVTPDEARSLDK